MSVFRTMINWLIDENKTQVTWILEAADKRRPVGYSKEVARRYNYLNGDMREDGLDFLKQEFPKSFSDMKYKMLQFPIAKFITRKRSQTFRGKGMRFHLVDRKGEEVPNDSPVAKSFQAMIKGSLLKTSLVETDRIEDICNGAGVKVWWDGDHVELSPYTGDKLHMALNPYRLWDPYSSMAVLFEQEGFDSITDKPRYEIWGAREPHLVSKETDSDGAPIYKPTLHYVASENEPIKVNEEDVNPYTDRYTGQPLYPFVWFRSRRGDVYWKGGDDLVEFNRYLNLVLTYLGHNAIWQMAATPMFTKTAGGGLGADEKAQLKKVIFSAPNKALQIPPGVEFSFVRPDVEIAPFQNLIEMLVQYEALMNNLSPKSIDIKGGLPQSGVALQIELKNLVDYYNERVPLLRPHVIRLLDVMISVWNTRIAGVEVEGVRHVRIPSDYRPEWVPGTMDTGPVDVGETIDTYTRGMEVGAYSPDDLVMAIHECDAQTAKRKIEENLARYREVMSMTTRYPEEPDRAEKAGKEIPIEEEDKDIPTEADKEKAKRLEKFVEGEEG